MLEHCVNLREAKVYAIKNGCELGDNMRGKVLAFAFGLSAEIKLELISLRTNESLARTKRAAENLGARQLAEIKSIN